MEIKGAKMVKVSLLAASGLGAAWLAAGCAHSVGLTCGQGTVEQDGVCIVDPSAGGGGSGSGAAGPSSAGSGPASSSSSSSTSAGGGGAPSSSSSTASSTGSSSSSGCAGNDLSCAGKCVDVTTDANNCGVCGSVCPPGAACQGGKCAGASGIAVLSYEVVDAQYSRQLDRIVMASTSPNALHVLDPIGATDVAVALPLPPSCVAVSPDGTKAVVGHDAWVSYIDLNAATIIKTIAVSSSVAHIALASDYAYAIPTVDQWVNFDIINLATLSEVSMQGFGGIWAGSPIRLSQAGDAVYLSDWGLSPETMSRYNLVNGKPMKADESPFGMYAPGGDMWVSEDGLRVFTAGGSTFKSSANPMLDLSYNGSFSNDPWIRWADSSSAAKKVAIIPSGMKDTELHLYEDQFLQFVSATPLPQFVAGNMTAPSHGKFVFFKSDGSKVFVILQADPLANALHDFGVTVL